MIFFYWTDIVKLDSSNFFSTSTSDHQILFLVCARVSITASQYEAESTAEGTLGGCDITFPLWLHQVVNNVAARTWKGSWRSFEGEDQSLFLPVAKEKLASTRFRCRFRV